MGPFRRIQQLRHHRTHFKTFERLHLSLRSDSPQGHVSPGPNLRDFQHKSLHRPNDRKQKCLQRQLQIKLNTNDATCAL